MNRLAVADAALALATVATGSFAATALIRPTALTGHEDTPGSRYYAGMYAARALPLAAAVLWGIASRQGSSPAVLAVAAGAQLGDAILGVRHRQVGQIVAPALLAAGYLWRAGRVGGYPG